MFTEWKKSKTMGGGPVLVVQTCRCSYSYVLFIMCFLGVFKCVKENEHTSFQGLFPSQFITYLVFNHISHIEGRSQKHDLIGNKSNRRR